MHQTYIIYRSELCLFQIMKNLLKKQIVVRLALFMHLNTKHLQMEHGLCPKYSTIYKLDMYNLEVRKKHLKNKQELKLTVQNMPSLSNLNITNAQRYKMVQKDMNNLRTRLVKFKDQTKAENLKNSQNFTFPK